MYIDHLYRCRDQCHELKMTKERQKREAATNEHKLKMIAAENNQLKLQIQLSEKQHKDNEAQRKHDKEEGEKSGNMKDKQLHRNKEQKEKKMKESKKKQKGYANTRKKNLKKDGNLLSVRNKGTCKWKSSEQKGQNTSMRGSNASQKC